MIVTIHMVPVTPDTSDIWALAGTVELVRQARTFRPGLGVYLVLNKVRAGTAEAAGAREMLEQAGLPILDAEVGLRITYGRFAQAGQGVVDYEPSGKAAAEVRQLADELEVVLDLGAGHKEVANG